MSDVKRKMTVKASVLNVLCLTPCPEHPQSGYIALSVIKQTANFVPDLEIFMFLGIATQA
jgi:hypothetical protein